MSPMDWASESLVPSPEHRLVLILRTQLGEPFDLPTIVRRAGLGEGRVVELLDELVELELLSPEYVPVAIIDRLAARQPMLFQTEFSNIHITAAQFQKLVVRMGSVQMVHFYIQHLSTWMKAKGRSYPDHYAAILDWWQTDKAIGKLPKFDSEGRTTPHGDRRYITER